MLENDILEFKNYELKLLNNEFSFNRFEWGEIMKNIIGMLNNKGGRIFIGFKEE